eukprot:jgi/Chlat1/742/Chrsp104S01221
MAVAVAVARCGRAAAAGLLHLTPAVSRSRAVVSPIRACGLRPAVSAACCCVVEASAQAAGGGRRQGLGLRGRQSQAQQPRRRQQRWHCSGATHASAAAPVTDTHAATPEAAASTSGRRNVVEVLRERGLIESVTSEDLQKAAAEKTLKVYCGFDPTADSLHLGNLLGIIVLSWFQRCGHVPVALVGGATARVGDPSGKSVERPMMDDDTIARNLAGIRGVLSSLLLTRAGEQNEAVVMNNYDWFSSISFLDFLRNVGKYVRVGTMLGKESVRTRLNSETGMSFTEFTYQLLQGYDFVHLFKEHDVSVQIGGSDQWGNITAGTDLIQKLLKKDGAFGLTFPLLTQSDGKKFGKSESGAIWLSSEKLSPYQFYQYLFRTADSDVVRFMKMLTFMELDEIERYQQMMQNEDGTYEPNTAQKRLAEEVTRFVHGEEGLHLALRATAGLAPGSDTLLDASALEAIAGDIPTVTLDRSAVVGCEVVGVLLAAGLTPSKSEGRRLVKNGGCYLNNRKIIDEKHVVEEGDAIDGRLLLLAAGKKKKALVRIQ